MLLTDSTETIQTFNFMLTLSQQLLTSLPLEQKVILSIALLIKYLARASQSLDANEAILRANKAAISATGLLEHPSIACIAELLTGVAMESNPELKLSRLSVESLVSMYTAMSELLSCAANVASFGQVHCMDMRYLQS